MRLMALYLGIAVLGVIAVACTESSVIEGADADISDVDAPAPLIVSPGAGAINGTGANASGLVGPVPSDVPLNGQVKTSSLQVFDRYRLRGSGQGVNWVRSR